MGNRHWIDGPSGPGALSDPPIARAVFGSTRAGWLWLPIRSYLGYEWAVSGVDHLRDPAWMDGATLQSYWWDAVARAPDFGESSSTDVVRAMFNQLIDADASELFARLIVFGELAVGVALVLGAFVGLAAFCGSLISMNFLLAGTVSSNPLMFAAAIGLMLAWRVGGYYGLDRYLLPTVMSGPATPTPT